MRHEKDPDEEPDLVFQDGDGWHVNGEHPWGCAVWVICSVLVIFLWAILSTLLG